MSRQFFTSVDICIQNIFDLKIFPVFDSVYNYGSMELIDLLIEYAFPQFKHIQTILYTVQFIEPKQIQNIFNLFEDFEDFFNFDLNQTDTIQYIFDCAVETNNLYIVDRLLQDGRANPARTSLIAATQHCYVDIVDRLLQDSRVDPSNDNNHALCIACDKNCVAIVDRLLQDDRVDPANALKYVALKKNINVIDILLQDKRVDLDSAFNVACKIGNVNMIDILLQKQFVPTINHLCTAIRFNSVGVVGRLLQKDGVDPSENQNYAIQFACEYGKDVIVDRLLQDRRVDPSANNNYAIQLACEYNFVSIVKRLLQDSRVIEESLSDARKIAIWRGYPELITLLDSKRLSTSAHLDPSHEPSAASTFPE
jgi:ankyrin repeat protein